MFDTYYWEVLMYPRFLIFERSTIRHTNLLPVYCNSNPIWSFLTQFLALPQMALNLKQNHISQVEWAILDAFHYYTPGSLYDKIRKSAFWGIMHDHISKIWNKFFGFTYVVVMNKTIHLMFYTDYQKWKLVLTVSTLACVVYLNMKYVIPLKKI